MNSTSFLSFLTFRPFRPARLFLWSTTSIGRAIYTKLNNSYQRISVSCPKNWNINYSKTFTVSLRLFGISSSISSTIISSLLSFGLYFPIASLKIFVCLMPQISSPTASSTPSITYSVWAASWPPVTFHRTCAIDPIKWFIALLLWLIRNLRNSSCYSMKSKTWKTVLLT